MATYKVTRDKITLEEIVYNYYGSSFGYIELVLENNRSLAKEGVYLSKGLVIELPELEKQPKVRATLWS